MDQQETRPEELPWSFYHFRQFLTQLDARLLGDTRLLVDVPLESEGPRLPHFKYETRPRKLDLYATTRRRLPFTLVLRTSNNLAQNRLDFAREWSVAVADKGGPKNAFGSYPAEVFA
jgi:hypothetical protein